MQIGHFRLFIGAIAHTISQSAIEPSLTKPNVPKI